MQDEDCSAWLRHQALFQHAIDRPERHAIAAPSLAREIAETLLELQLFPAQATIDRHVPQLVVFSYLCAPRAASARGLRAAATFLYVFFLLNDYGLEPHPFVETWLSNLLSEHGLAAKRFESSFKLYRQSLDAERLLRNRAQPCSLAEYVDKREGRYQWVATSPYIELWELVEGVSVPDQARASTDPLKDLAVELTYLANDIGSLRRDASTCNFVPLLLRELGTQATLADALAQTALLYREKARAFRELASPLGGDWLVASYVDMLAHIADGNLRATYELAAESKSGRYEIDSRQCLEQLLLAAQLTTD